jgi:hypothetical protein
VFWRITDSGNVTTVYWNSARNASRLDLFKKAIDTSIPFRCDIRNFLGGLYFVYFICCSHLIEY